MVLTQPRIDACEAGVCEADGCEAGGCETDGAVGKSPQPVPARTIPANMAISRPCAFMSVRRQGRLIGCALLQVWREPS
jgi:hypothetical protein